MVWPGDVNRIEPILFSLQTQAQYGFRVVIKYEMRGDNGDEFWAPINDDPLNKIDIDGLVAYLGGVDYYEQEHWREKRADAALNGRQKEAQIGLIGSQAGRNYASATKLGASGAGTSSESKLPGGFKNSGEQFFALKGGTSEAGFRVTQPDGKIIDLPHEDAAIRIQYHLSNIAEANPGMSYADAVDAARKMTEAENGEDTKGGNYAPVYDIDPTTG